MKLKNVINEILNPRTEILKIASNLYSSNSALGTAHFEIIQRLGEKATKKQIEDEAKAFNHIVAKEKMGSLIANLCQHYGCGDVNSKKEVDRTVMGKSGRLGHQDPTAFQYNPGAKPGNPGPRSTDNPV